METLENTHRMQQCPHFQTCNAPLCPLDEFQNQRIVHANDPVCNMEKQVRKRIGKDMKTNGLTKNELKGLKIWNARTDKDEHIKRATKRLKALRRRIKNKKKH